MGKFLQKVLLNPIFVLSVLGFSILMGLSQPDAVKGLDSIGGYYISLLKMIVLPYLVVTIITGVAKVASDPSAKRYTWRLVTTYPLAMVFSASLAVGACFLVAPVGEVNQAVMAELGGHLSNGETQPIDKGAVVTFSGAEIESENTGEHGILDRFVPDNIFAALSSGDTLKVVIFCIIFGAALAQHKDEGMRTVLDVFNVIKLTCIKVILLLNLLLPFALFGMISSMVANVGVGPLISLAPFVLVQTTIGIVLIAISALIISNRAGVSPFAAITKLHETIILAITTRSSFACIPVAVRELTERLNLDRSGTDLVMPLGTTICRIGAVPYFAIGTIFIAEVYGVELSWLAYLMIVLGSVAAGFASSGATGAMGVILISIVAAPLNLPVEAAIALFIAVDPILDMIRTVVLVYGNCALTSVIIPRPKLEVEQVKTETISVKGAST
jgi:proton glutamate symport protein